MAKMAKRTAKAGLITQRHRVPKFLADFFERNRGDFRATFLALGPEECVKMVEEHHQNAHKTAEELKK